MFWKGLDKMEKASGAEPVVSSYAMCFTQIIVQVWNFIYVFFLLLVAQSCLPLCHPMDVARIHYPWGFSRKEYCSGQPFPSPRGPLDQRSNPGLLHHRHVLYHWATRETLNFHIHVLKYEANYINQKFSSVQFSRSVVANSLRPRELQHARPPCLSPSPRVHSTSCPLSQWWHPAISSSVIPFSSCPQSLPASESFPMS